MRADCDERHHAWPLFLEAYAVVVDLLDSELRRERGLPLAWFDVLVALAGAPEGRLAMNQLSDSVLLSKSGVTRLVDRMARAGLVARASCPSDRRVVFARLTPQGRVAFRRAAPVAFRGVAEHFAAHLSAAEEQALAAAFTRMIRAGRARRGALRAAM